MTKAIKVTPLEMQGGDRVSISVGALDGDVLQYTFDKVADAYDANRLVVEFLIGGNWPNINFVLAKDALYDVEREIAAIA